MVFEQSQAKWQWQCNREQAQVKQRKVVDDGDQRMPEQQQTQGQDHELHESDPNRKFKGRVVFEGCYVKDEENNWAIFSEIASCPASMEASRSADAFGLLPGHSIEIADGESAYTQARLGGDLTYIRIPKERFIVTVLMFPILNRSIGNVFLSKLHSCHIVGRVHDEK